MTTWADTTGLARPVNDSAYYRAAWLLGRHPQLVDLVDRTGLVTVDPNDPEYPDLELDWLAAAFAPDDAQQQVEYPLRDEYLARIEHAARAIGPMSGGEKRRLRLLATLAPTIRVAWNLGEDLYGLDGEGQRLVEDWISLVQRA